MTLFLKNIPIALFFLFSYQSIRAQSYHFKNYQVNAGISSNTVTCMLQDKKGFMWFGTRNGLNRFDGDNFRVFRNNVSDSLSIGSNSILSLYEDSEERLWIGTYNGVYIYHPQKEAFAFFKNGPTGETRYIQQDARNNIWMITDYVLYRYSTGIAALSSYKKPNEQTTSIHISEKGDLWAATNNGMIKKYNPASDDFTQYTVFKEFKKNSPNQIQEIYVLNDTTILIGTMKEVLQYNTKTGKTKNIFQGYKWSNEIHTNQILRQTENEFWFGTENGLYIYDIKTGEAKHVQKEHGNPYSLTDNVIYAFCKDSEGGTWLATFWGGVNYYSRQFNRFQKYFPGSGSNHISGNLVHEICGDKNGNIWIGTEDAGLNKLDPARGTIKHFMPGKTRHDISCRNLHGLVADGDRLWIATYEHGLDVLNLRTETIE